ncbi:MAG TPA: PqqD family protein [Gemmatimonadaceae bacterium]
MTYRRSLAVDETPVGERVVLYHRVSGSAIVLNPSASLLWRALEHEHSTASLTASLQKKFPSVDQSRIEADVMSCLDDLASHQLVSAQAENRGS